MVTLLVAVVLLAMVETPPVVVVVAAAAAAAVVLSQQVTLRALDEPSAVLHVPGEPPTQARPDTQLSSRDPTW